MIYLDNAATTFPKPECVTREVSRCLREYCGNPGRGSHRLSLYAAERIYECREETAAMFSSVPENVVFTSNTTSAINTAVKGYIKPGMHVLISDLEHNSVLRPIAEAERRGIITYGIFSVGSPSETILSIRRELRENTAMLICTAQSNIVGIRPPIGEIGAFCRSRGIIFAVDGAQAAGYVPLDMKSMSIDILCLPGHKGLYGVQGCGIMILREGMELGETVFEGGSGSRSVELSMPDILPDRYEAGTLPTPAIVGTLEGIKWVKRQTVTELARHEERLVGRVGDAFRGEPRIVLYGACAFGGVLFNIDGINPSEVAERLNSHAIAVRSGLHCAPLAHGKLGTGKDGAVRVSFGAFNTEYDADRLIDCVYRMQKSVI